MSILDEGYGIIPKAFMKEPGLDVYTKAVMAYLLSYTGAGKLECWPAITTIAQHLQISKRKTIEAIQKLQDHQYIRKERLYNDPWKKNNKYYLTILDGTESAPGEPSRGTPGTFQVHPVPPNNNILNNNTIEQIYDAYPTKDPNNNQRSTGKGGKNRQQIERLLASGRWTAETLLAAQAAYLADCARTKTYIKNYSTFLNNVPEPAAEQPTQGVQVADIIKAAAEGRISRSQVRQMRNEGKIDEKGEQECLNELNKLATTTRKPSCA